MAQFGTFVVVRAYNTGRQEIAAGGYEKSTEMGRLSRAYPVTKVHCATWRIIRA